MQQLIMKLQEQIAYIIQLLVQQQKPVCGNGVCETAKGETATSCVTDCQTITQDITELIPIQADVATCTSNTGQIYKTTGTADYAKWFIWNGCTKQKTYNLTAFDTRPLILNAYGDTCPNCVCRYPNFTVYENRGGAWFKVASVNLSTASSLNRNYLYYPGSNIIKIEAQSCFYQRIFQGTEPALRQKFASLEKLPLIPVTQVCGNGFCESNETSANCPADCQKITTCKNLWWTDNTSKICQQKQFCDNYAYLGLKTYDTQSACQTTLDATCSKECVAKGYALGGNYCVANESGILEVCCCSGSRSVCGNNICENSETAVSCPADCAVGNQCGVKFGTQATDQQKKACTDSGGSVNTYGSNEGTIYYCKCCTDSDGGLNYYQKGTLVTVGDGNGAYYDLCSATNANIVKEWSCGSNNNPIPTEFTCPNGCKDGACITNLSIAPCSSDYPYGGGACMPMAGKPVIYFYPQKIQTVNVKLDIDGKLIADYPSYDPVNGWNVTAYPSGYLINHADNKEYSYLFWEASDFGANYDMSQGFVVKGSQTKEFLQTILPKIGLIPKEYNEFIVYWYPKMKDNPYNIIHFAAEEYASRAKLTITPQPDSLLRVFMIFKSSPVWVPTTPQAFPVFERKGFTVVEWGGSEIK